MKYSTNLLRKIDDVNANINTIREDLISKADNAQNGRNMGEIWLRMLNGYQNNINTNMKKTKTLLCKSRGRKHNTEWSNESFE